QPDSTTMGTKDDQKEVHIPEWLTSEVFKDLIKHEVKDFKKIKSLRARAGVPSGENYATIMLRVELDIETKGKYFFQRSRWNIALVFKLYFYSDNSQVTKAFMLKLPHSSEAYRKIIEKTDMFDVERGMYLEVVPELEQLYREVGVEVKFGATAYEIPASDYYVLLEDLKPRGFQNANRLEGLDQAHTESALRKFAQWHAASAVRVELKGPYPEKYTKGFLSNEEIVDAFCSRSVKIFLEHVHLVKGYEPYVKDLRIISEKLQDIVQDINDVKPDDFNALNHGDGWANNIMFQYNESKGITETYFVDLQLPKWGTVTQDLYYFLLSSAQLDIKTSKFDYFIWFYHSELVKHLKLLKYSKPLPTLRSIRDDLAKYNGWGYHTVLMLCPPVLLDRTDDANVKDFVTESENGDGLKMAMYSNARYKKHVSAILTWLNNRGALQQK
ncbi:hypothetical protein KR067_008716, partial [Drosophila pandora]